MSIIGRYKKLLWWERILVILGLIVFSIVFVICLPVLAIIYIIGITCEVLNGE